ncbi:MarR family transcriptional regulator [Mycolicibacterium sp.]|uniref:MarR family winged helix-turn-helix transcriptional regulator n=1 Tax=Mycolicibacterium sp. TaxID=2320850 RepID=UPI001A2A8D9A|nr:MarR family transcriptional regulator [Mycolicibacterium sp.]MBJ7336287.1 MarR family transcriptional regulator [Mycolicibacterium sp.]
MSDPDVEGGAGYLVKRVQQSMRRRCDAALRPTGLSMAQYAALRALADHPDASASELARLCFVTRQSLHDLLAGLRSSGLVRAAVRPGPGRTTALALTAAGRARLTASHEAVIGVEEQMVQGLSATSRRQLAELLAMCAENLENGPAE